MFDSIIIEIKKESIMPAVFLVSDTHFGHAGVCRFLREDGSKLRPWDDPSEMDEAMIKRWNERVRPNDKVYHLGEMVTATQSVDEDTFTLLGAELGFVIQIVSPEDEDRELLEEFDINLEQELARLPVSPSLRSTSPQHRRE